jgi:hypothetical protein
MALGARKPIDRHKIIDADKLRKISQSFEGGKHLELEVYESEAAMLYQMQELTDDVKEIHRYLGSEVTSNTATNLSSTANGTSLTINSSDGNNASIPAATTNAWGAMTDENFDAIAANTAKTGITSGQTSAITANTAKTTFPGFGTTSTRAMRGNTTTISSGQSSAISANLLKASSVGFYKNQSNGTETVWIPGTQFYSPTIVYNVGKVTDSNSRGLLTYEWPGIDGKKVIAAHVVTSANVSRATFFRRWRLATASSLAILGGGRGDNSNTDVNTTDWTCAVGEAFQISQGLPSTSTYLLGAYLILTDV